MSNTDSAWPRPDLHTYGSIAYYCHMTSTLNTENAYTVWVCEDCNLTHHGYPLDELGREYDVTPLHLFNADALVTAGMLSRDHDCENRWVGFRTMIGCGEELRDFDTRACDGCGSTLAGTRHALTVWG